MRIFLFLGAMMLAFVVAAAPASAQERRGFFSFGGSGESDVGFLTRLLQDSLSSTGREVRIEGFRGALSSRATFDEMTIADDDGIWLRIEGAALQWNRSALLQRRIEIAEISAERVTVLRGPVAEPREEIVPRGAFELPELPVSIRIAALDLDEVVLGEALLGEELRAAISGAASLADGSGAATLRVERIDEIAGSFVLDGAFSNETRVLGLDLRVEEDPGGLAVTLLDIPGAPSATLTVQGEGPLDSFGADITLATDGEPRLAGRFDLETGGEGVTRAVSFDLGGDLRPVLDEEFHAFFGSDSRITARARQFDDGRLSLDALEMRTDKLALEGRVELGEGNRPELIDLRGEIASRDGSRVLLPVPGAQTTIETASLELGFDAAVNEDWDLVLDVIGFDNGDFTVETLFLNGLGRITSQAFGEERNVVDALLDFSALGLTAADPALDAALGSTVTGSLALIWREGLPLLLPGFVLEGEGYAVNGRAQLDDGVIAANAQAELRDIARFSQLAGRPLSGSARAQVDATVGPERDRFLVAAELSGTDLSFDQEELDRLLAGRSEITLDAHGADGVIELRRLEALATTLRADLRGQVSEETVDLRGELDFTDLGVLGTDFGGQIAMQLAVRGAIERETLTVEATARDLTIGQPEADRLLRGETRLSVSGQRDGQAFDLAALRLENAALTASANGRYDAGASRIDAQFALSNLGAVREGLGGAIRGDLRLREQGETRALELDATSTNLRVGNAAADTLLAGSYRLSTRVVQRPEDILLERVNLTGPQLSASVDGRLRDGRPDLTINGRLNNLGLVVPGIDGPVTLSGTARDTGTGYALDLGVGGPAGLRVQLAGTVSQDMRADLRASGTTNLALINPRIEPRSIQGPAEFDLRINGPLEPASLSGTARASGADVVLPRQNIRLTDVNLQAQIAGARAQVSATGRSVNGGTVSASGSVGLEPPFTGDLQAQLNALRIVDPQLFETQVSGTVTISGPLTAGPLIGGRVTLDETEIRIPRVGLGSSGYIPPDLVHLGDSAGARATRERAGIYMGESNGREGIPPRINLRIDAPNRIFLRGRGLDAELGGGLRLTGTTADIIPIGQFNLIRGRLDLLGNRFDLNEGFASLQGDFVPFVRLIASTQRNGTTARIVLEGRADAPEIRFESTPELPEEEVVSLLLFGRGFDSLSVFQAAQLASSLATLSGRSEGVLSRIRRNVGLDDLDVVTDEDGETAIRLGRYLTETIYTDIEVSPTGSSEVSINIDLTSSLTGRARVNDEGRSSVGLFFERDY